MVLSEIFSFSGGLVSINADIDVYRIIDYVYIVQRLSHIQTNMYLTYNKMIRNKTTEVIQMFLK